MNRRYPSSMLRTIALMSFIFVLAACNGGGGSAPTGGSAAYTVGGTVSGLASGASVVLQNNGGNNLTLSSNGSFHFSASLGNNAPYNVVVSMQPSSPAQICSVNHGTGTVSGTNVSDIQVVCSTTTYSVHAAVTGLAGSGLVLQNNGSDNVSVSANGTVTFPAVLASGAAYRVTVAAQPSGQSCGISAGSGTISTTDVTVQVSCVTAVTYNIGGNVSGLASGRSIGLRNNGSDSVTVTTNGPFSFPSALANGAAYAVSVATQPPGQTCGVAGGSGNVNGANVTGVTISCANLPTYTVGGSVSGLASGARVTLQDNGGDNVVVNANGGFVFPVALYSGDLYKVTVSAQPTAPSQTCTVTQGNGTVGSANVTGVSVSCTTNSYSIGGTVSGLGSGKRVTLQNNNGDNLSVSANGGFVFATAIASGATYNVTVLTQPVAQTCNVTQGSGSVGGAAVTAVQVTCSNLPTYTIGGSVSGLAAGQNVVLRNNGGDDLTVSANGGFTFATGLITGGVYNITVLRSPAGQSCSVTSGSGTVTGANVTTAQVTCGTNRALRGTVYGLTGSGLVLTANNGEQLSINGKGTVNFAFAQGIGEGSAYNVAVLTQPSTPAETCYVSNGSGTAGPTDITGIAVVCPVDTFWSHPQPQGDSVNKIRLLNNQLVGVTSTGTALFGNSAGTSWTVRTVGPYVLNGVTWTGNQYVAVGNTIASPNNGVVVTSADGITWMPQTLPTTAGLDAVTWTGSTLIAVGKAGTILTSPNGVTWTPRTSGTTRELYGVTNGGNPVAVGDAVILNGTADGSAWTGVGTGSSWILLGVSYANGTYVAVGLSFNGLVVYPPNAYVATSTNGVTWTTAIPPAGIYGLWDTAYSGSQWVAAGYQGTIATSTNGTTWVKQTNVPSYWDLYSVLWNTGTGNFVVGGQYGTMLGSSNGSSWTHIDSAVTAAPLNHAVWTGDHVVAAGGVQYGATLYSSAVISSVDGTGGWVSHPINTTQPLRAVAASPTQWVAVGANGTMLYSSNKGASWNAVTPLTAVELEMVKYIGGQFIAVGQQGAIYTSPDGVNWASHSASTTATLSVITALGSRLVVAGTGSTVLTSDNQGVTWTPRTGACIGGCSDAAVAGNQIVLLQSSGSSYYTSTDGITWTTRYVPNGVSTINHLVWANNTLFATGQTYSPSLAPVLLQSADGTTWQVVNTLPAGASSLVWTGARLILVGGSILYGE